MVFIEENLLKSINFKRKFFCLVRFWIDFFSSCQFQINFITTRQFSNWMFYNVSGFERTSFPEFCQIFMRSSKQGTFRYCFDVWYGFCCPNSSFSIGFFAPTVINVTRRIQTTNSIPFFPSEYVDRECYLTRFYQTLWGLQRTEISSLISKTHLWWRHVQWSGREPTWSSVKVGYRVVAEEGVHLCKTLGWTSAMY